MVIIPTIPLNIFSTYFYCTASQNPILVNSNSPPIMCPYLSSTTVLTMLMLYLRPKTSSSTSVWPAPQCGSTYSTCSTVRNYFTTSMLSSNFQYSSWLCCHYSILFQCCCHCCSIDMLCPTLCNPMDYSKPDFPVLHHLPEKLKLQYFGHLIGRVDSMEKNLIQGKSEGRRNRDDRGRDDWMASLTQWICCGCSLSYLWVFATPWTVACQASLSFTISQSLLRLVSIESVMPSNHLIICCPLLLLPSIFPSIKVFSNESVLRIRWTKYLSLAGINFTIVDIILILGLWDK